MPTKDSSVKGIRLADSEWAAVDAEAKRLGMTRNEYIGRQILNRSSRLREVCDSDQIVAEGDMTLEQE